uniref:Uncharacterized protein n=1 Tax=Rhizophagus irregularis (strain DAOM 181602 / DAOM 197198 / MUCL 43194) TaxID=747089 RepID=U9TZ24_RHIID
MNPMNLCKYISVAHYISILYNNSTGCSRHHALSVWCTFDMYSLISNKNDTIIYYFFKMPNLKFFINYIIQIS